MSIRSPETETEGGQGQKAPWEGEPTRLHLPEEDRAAIQLHIRSTLIRKSIKNERLVASELGHEVARTMYEAAQEAGLDWSPTTGDVILEIAKLRGTKIRMGATNHLFWNFSSEHR